jgi:hypothetical protein
LSKRKENSLVFREILLLLLLLSLRLFSVSIPRRCEIEKLSLKYINSVNLGSTPKCLVKLNDSDILKYIRQNKERDQRNKDTESTKIFSNLSILLHTCSLWGFHEQNRSLINNWYPGTSKGEKGKDYVSTKYV